MEMTDVNIFFLEDGEWRQRLNRELQGPRQGVVDPR